MDGGDDAQSDSGNWDNQETTLLPFRLPDLEDDLYVDGPLSRSEFDLPNGPLLRFQAYSKAWDRCLGRVKKIVHNLQQHVVNDIMYTIQNAYGDSPEDINLPAPELVTVLVSSSDRTYVHECFAQILEAFGEKINTASHDESEAEATPVSLISRISENDCQSITSIMKALISGFINQPLGIKIAKKMKASQSLANYDMYILRAWYHAVKELYGNNTPPLIVMIQDLHLIDPTNLRDLFELCTCHIPHVPISFLLGSSDSNHLHSVLPRSTLACLRLERYNLPWDVKILEKLVKETFFSLTFVPSVTIGPAGFEMIFLEFKRHNSTLDGLLSMLQLLHMQHFYNPLGFICDDEYDPILNNVLDAPSDAWKPFFQLLRQQSISSLMATGSAMDQTEWSKLTPQDVMEQVVEARAKFRSRMIRVKVALHILETIICFGRERALKVTDSFLTSFETMGLEGLRGTLGDRVAPNACNLMRQLKHIESQALLEELFHYVHKLPNSARIMESKLKLELVIAKNEVDDQTLARFLQFLTLYLRETLIPFDDIAYLDVWWTGEIGIPNVPLNPNPHISIVTSLLEPHEYLGWDLDTGSHRTLSSLPDVSILFRRYVESGKMINIYDWYDSFSVALEDLGSHEDGNEDDIEMDETPSKRKVRGIGTRQTGSEIGHVANGLKREVQARFLRSMHEMAFVGFLKPTGRKADHVLKTVFDVID